MVAWGVVTSKTSTSAQHTDTDDSDTSSLYSESEPQFHLTDKEIDSSDRRTAQEAELISQK